MITYHLAAITMAFIIDAIVGDPPKWPHPVKWIGSLIGVLRTKLNNGENKIFKGMLMLLIVLFVVGSATFLIVWLSYIIHPIAGVFAEAVIISTTIAQKSLKEAALEVYHPLKNGDLSGARLKLSYIVGRDTDRLEEPEIVRGTVETVAENTSDGITAPLFWALIGGAPLAMVYRAVNTCDSMVGYKNERYFEFGRASAKLDDILNWIPSRVTSLCMMAVNKPKYMTKRKAWEIVLRDAKKHPSPNSGWGEAAVGSLLGIQLGGINYYQGVVSNRATMGEPITSLENSHIILANKIVTRTVPFFILLLWIGGIIIEMASTWS